MAHTTSVVQSEQRGQRRVLLWHRGARRVTTVRGTGPRFRDCPDMPEKATRALHRQ